MKRQYAVKPMSDKYTKLGYVTNIIGANSPKEALELYCNIHNIKYTKIEKLTAAKNKEYTDEYNLTPMQVAELIDFIVYIPLVYNPNSIGNYKIKE